MNRLHWHQLYNTLEPIAYCCEERQRLLVLFELIDTLADTGEMNRICFAFLRVSENHEK